MYITEDFIQKCMFNKQFKWGINFRFIFRILSENDGGYIVFVFNQPKA